MPGLPQSWTDFELYMSCNLLATQRLLEATRRTGVERPFVHVSTSSVYGLRAIGDEETPLRPSSPYGVTKLAAEKLVLAYAETFGLPAVVLRYFSIYGPRQRPDMGYHRFIDALLTDQPITIFGDGSAVRTSTYVSDCVEGTLLALQRGRPGCVYNLGGRWPLTVNETIRHLAEVIGTRPKLAYASPRAGDQAETRAVIDRAHDQLGYQPQVDPQEGLRRQIEWQRRGVTSA
jgi:nucleoside-diphosphate-sugar epimerase